MPRLIICRTTPSRRCLRLLFDETFRHFELVRIEQFTYQFVAQVVIRFSRRSRFEILAHLRLKCFDRIEIVTETLDPFVVELGQFFLSNSGDFCHIFNFLAGETGRS